jgi:hypothetical protein
METIQSKSILAKLMATENLHIEQRRVGTASFDVEQRILTIPILDEKLSSNEYDLFLGHEVGHALYTPVEGMRKAYDMKLSMSVMNVLEDSGIERKIKTKYPGLRQPFILAYKDLVARDFFGTNGKDLNEMNFIDRVNLYCKAGIETGIKFTEEETELLTEIENTQTYDDVIEVCKKVGAYMEEEQKRKPQPSDDGDFDDSDEFDDDSFGDSGEGEGSEEKEGKSSGSKQTDDDSDGEKSEPKDKSSGDTSGKDKVSNEAPNSAGAGNQGTDKFKPVSETDESYRQNESKLFSKSNKVYYYGNVPDLKLEKIVIDHKTLWDRYRLDVKESVSKSYYEETVNDVYARNTQKFIKFREESKKVVSYLVKEFEMRKNADQLKRASVAKTGELNMNKIFSYKFSEDIFKKISVIPGGKSHGLVMFIDWSGSMSNHIENTVKQLLNLVLFCKKINLPYEVYAFTTEHWHIGNAPIAISPKRNDMILHDFRLMNLFSSKMSAADFTFAAGSLLNYVYNRRLNPHWFCLAGTPLNKAIVAAMKIVPMFQKENRLQIVNTVFLTDGDGNRCTDISDGLGRVIPQSGSRSIVIRDPITKHEETVQDFRGASELTSAYIKLFKKRTNSNVVGFYILYGRELYSALDKFDSDENKKISNYDKEKLEFRNKKYRIVTSAGFDEYYLLRSESLDTDEDADFEVDDKATMRGIASAFNKYAAARKTNRVVLNRFIDIIA